MFCANCGTENKDGVAFCSNCGKSPNNVAIKKEDTKMANYPLINLSSKLFYPIFEIWLWFNLIVCTVGGGIASYFITRSTDFWSGRSSGGNPIPGVLIGFVVGFLTIIISGGLTSIFLKINENIEKMTRN